MKLRGSWCAALVASLAMLTSPSADAANGRNYQMAGDAGRSANIAMINDANVEQTSYSSTYPSGANGFGIASPLVDRQYQFFAYGEYIYARASFSEALAYIESDPNDPQGGQEIVEYDFDYNSSYRFGGGINFCDCGGAVIFNFARYTSDADVLATDTSSAPQETIFGPYEIIAPQGGGSIEGHADVDIKSYDIGWAKTIPLGGPAGCCDPCCGDVSCDPCCGSGVGAGCCPAWDVTWSAGVRFADVDWGRNTTAFEQNGTPVDREDTRLSFSGAGLRTGLMGRRYVGRNGWFSVFARGDVSLLVGDVDIRTDTTDNLGGVPLTLRSHSNSARRVIPVTEIEAGGSLDLTSNVRMSAGYFISAWHDLGMRDEFNFSNTPGIQISHYDDANILGFDGFFARVDVAF